MKVVKILLLYLLVVFYLFMGTMHFIQSEPYFAMMPSWLPEKKGLLILSGVTEIVLALLLIPSRSRSTAARLIIVMLVVFLLIIHIPESMGYYQTNSDQFIRSIVRLPTQFLFIAWAWLFAKK